MKLKTFAILLSLSTACSSATYAMNSDQEDRLTALQKQRQATIEKGREIQAMQAQLRQQSKERMEDAQKRYDEAVVAKEQLKNESFAILDAMRDGTMSYEEAERRLNQLESKAKAK